ncbi:DNA mismatch repair protein MutS [Listeria seeligeri]|uniref:DNA mismatch repair protein MutS n=1 Tax=Listeria seeligeri TaxID=1640 RepID=UPI0010EBEE49|nr:DNA mismatch repair protein MutS [Listeria seeligeri]MBC1423759.1 DNA mismatch repair protein MutS [Listeria seeligeri]MBC1527175.1 DNA mismatch repair protein MutS [Listeria seeligeri]MBC1725556.1 DNA mismatch repair protein MutS [Listeria seeligeri]MBC1732470.1 DNA mismatch repair protein MutS [Listeria seeligeri]MBC1733446.1 DNA mismatch repair protein MutS [Listeria seeligeri]
MAEYTPMIKQYLEIKDKYQDAFLFFRLGDFYEMFFEDALNASQILEITLTGREGGTKEKIPMCGVPYHSASGYIDTLIEKGYKVAICEQVEDPKTTKGMVKREVVQLISPGTVMDERGLKAKENNYIAALYCYEGKEYGFAYSDLSTGELKSTVIEASEDRLINELTTLSTKELIVSESEKEVLSNVMKEQLGLTFSVHEEDTIPTENEKLVTRHMSLSEKRAIGKLLHYLKETQKRDLGHLQQAVHYETSNYMKMDYYSKRNLELAASIRGKGRQGTLLWLLDNTQTAMGGRMLKQWIDRPLIDRNKIIERQNDVSELMAHFFERLELVENLKNVYDLERLAGRVAYGNVNARDLIQLRNSLYQIPRIRATLLSMNTPSLTTLANQLDPCEELTEKLEEAITDSAPISIREGGIIKDGYNSQLDTYRDASRNGKTWIAELERKERELTGIKTMKVGFNRVFGYYIEVTRANTHLLPEGRYERKQTLTNAERYITPELKEKEKLILDAEEKSMELEYQLFTEVRETVKDYIERLQKLAKSVSEIDCLQSFADISEKNHFIRPTLSEDGSLHVKQGRHPVVEKVMGAQSYVANDCDLDANREILLITGPNMSGKSTYMRQVALTAICAQVGCFVPAEEAVLPIFDQIFTRIGAADDLIAGQSTFMVEMLEARNAIVHATKDSLILFDEIGRGTATYDGMALAQAIIEYIHENVHAKTLFSTHYHELTDLEKELRGLQNIHVSAVEENGKVVFLHKIKEGPADKSYGIHVAELAELPTSLIERARRILEQLENDEKKVIISNEKQPEVIHEEVQLSMFPVEPEQKISSKEAKLIKEIATLNIMQMTPMDAMNKLYELQSKTH